MAFATVDTVRVILSGVDGEDIEGGQKMRLGSAGDWLINKYKLGPERSLNIFDRNIKFKTRVFMSTLDITHSVRLG